MCSAALLAISAPPSALCCLLRYNTLPWVPEDRFIISTMSRDVDLPLALWHDQVLTNTAYTSVPGNVYSNVHVGAGGRSHLGNSYNYGPTEDQQILHSILQSLHYPEMGQRGSDVPDAGADTFEWLFGEYGRQPSHDSDESDKYEQEFVDDEGQSMKKDAYDEEEREYTSEEDLSDVESTYSEDQSERDDIAVKLRSWLKDDGDNVFWVTGKPGSGKSTFMKFLRDHDGTHELLQEWAREDLLVTADHFFWLPGTPLQNSFEGLARSLMHAILSSLHADIDSAKSICTRRRWSLITSHRPWSQSEFKRMFVNLGGLRGIRVFLLIDGLDECCPQQKHDDLMDGLMDIVRSSSIKACLSSRPWREFATRLERSPSLCLERITRFDMVTYVSNRFHQAMQERKMLAKVVRKLVSLVVGRADGVFLWVELVVRAVIIELKKGRGMSRVSSIVEDLPSELDDYFTKLIYERIEKTTGNTSDTASVLSLAIRLEHRRSLDYAQAFKHHAFLDFWLLSRGALDESMKCPNADVPKYSQEKVAVMRAQTRSFLELASKDLLVLRGSKVEFTHRTVFDFLMSGSVNEAIRERSLPHFQHPDFMLCLQTLRCIHSLMMSDITCQMVDDALYFVARHPNLDTTTARTNYSPITTICESLAIDHLHNSRSCLGIGGGMLRGPLIHRIRSSPKTPTAFGMSPMPYRYVRALYRRWPHFTNTWLIRQYLSESGYTSTQIRHMKLRSLCGACTDIMHDCLYTGAIPDRWIAPKKSASRYRFNPKKICEPFVSLDDGPRRSLCEFCGVHLPRSRDCGLRDAFFLLEKTAFERLLPRADFFAYNEPISPLLEHRIIKVLPFELPWSILRRADGLRALKATLRFRKFVWCRQKLRAVRSLLTTVRRQLLVLTNFDVVYDRSTYEAFLHLVHASWQTFIASFLVPPAWRAGHDPGGSSCECCSNPIHWDDSVLVFLWSDSFPTFCEACHKKAPPPPGLKPSHMFAIKMEYELHLPSSVRLRENRSVVDAIVEVISWYSDTAPAFGLGYLIPSDTAEIQRKLLLVPESLKESY